MVSEKLLQELNEQMNREFESAYLYLAMSAHFDAENWKGSAHWLREQAKEELEHAMKFYDHILEIGGRPILKNIAQPQEEWKGHLDAFEAALAHEKKITAHIHDLYNMAMEEKAHATTIFLQWFITEQVEEENSAEEIVMLLKRVGDQPQGLFMIDRQLGARSGH